MDKTPYDPYVGRDRNFKSDIPEDLTGKLIALSSEGKAIEPKKDFGKMVNPSVQPGSDAFYKYAASVGQSLREAAQEVRKSAQDTISGLKALHS